MPKEAGHTFLAKLGKKRLRPGGKKATDWLIKQGLFSADKKVLEVACNMGTTTIELAKRFGCHITAIDLDEKALNKATQAVHAHQLDHLISLQKANAMALPFPDNSFDIVINEAMLTMQTQKGKVKCLSEYLRVLKPGGILLTHDVMLKRDDTQIITDLSKAINIHAQPMTTEGWTRLFEQQGFTTITTLSGDMSLMNIKGMIYDEGVVGTLTILKNALQPENREQFKRMFTLFKNNQDKLGFIACAAKKRPQ